MAEGDALDQAQEAQAEMCHALQKALRSTTSYTVQAMPDGVEIIHVESGTMERKFRLVEVEVDTGLPVVDVTQKPKAKRAARR